jgi:membrane protein involved in colicin uptake
MDAIFPLKSKKSIKAVNQVVNHNNTVTRLKIQNALYLQELNRVKAANDSANAALALAQQQAHEAALALAHQQAREAAQKAAHDAAQKAAHEAMVSAKKAAHDAAQKAAHEAMVSAQKAAHEAAQKAAQQNIANNNTTKSTKFGKLLSKMNKQH